MNLIPNVPPKIFSFSAVVVGYLLIDDLTANEQNALGNWLMLTSQVLCTNAYYKQVQQERGIDTGLSDKANNPNIYGGDEAETVIMLEKMVKALQKEIQEIKTKL